MPEKLLKIRNLQTSFKIAGKYYAAVDNVNLDIYKNEIFAIVGESGSGKSAMALSVTGLHNKNYTKVEGSVLYKGQNLLIMGEDEINKIRGCQISMIFQDSLQSLNPLIKIGLQVEESLLYHTNLNKAERKTKALHMLKEVELPEITYSKLPHELSGGMRQRVMIAIATITKPKIIIADEPTTALDVTIQATILELLKKLQKETRASIILITHDLGVVAEIADRVGVMYAGQMVEVANVYDLFQNPKHPYTRALLGSVPGGKGMLKTINGTVPPLQYMPKTGCRFALRTPWVPNYIHEKNSTYHRVSPGHYVLCSCYKRS